MSRLFIHIVLIAAFVFGGVSVGSAERFASVTHRAQQIVASSNRAAAGELALSNFRKATERSISTEELLNSYKALSQSDADLYAAAQTQKYLTPSLEHERRVQKNIHVAQGEPAGRVLSTALQVNQQSTNPTPQVTALLSRNPHTLVTPSTSAVNKFLEKFTLATPEVVSNPRKKRLAYHVARMNSKSGRKVKSVRIYDIHHNNQMVNGAPLLIQVVQTPRFSFGQSFIGKHFDAYKPQVTYFLSLRDSSSHRRIFELQTHVFELASGSPAAAIRNGMIMSGEARIVDLSQLPLLHANKPELIGSSATRVALTPLSKKTSEQSDDAVIKFLDSKLEGAVPARSQTVSPETSMTSSSSASSVTATAAKKKKTKKKKKATTAAKKKKGPRSILTPRARAILSLSREQRVAFDGAQLQLEALKKTYRAQLREGNSLKYNIERTKILNAQKDLIPEEALAVLESQFPRKKVKTRSFDASDSEGSNFGGELVVE